MAVDKPKLVINCKVGEKEGSFNVNLDEVPPDGAEFCIKVGANGISSAPIRENTADQNRGRSGSKENKNDAQVSRNGMEKLLSALKNALKDDKISSVIDSSSKAVIEDVIENGNRFLNRNPQAKKDEIEEKMKMVKLLCEPLTSALVDGHGLSITKRAKTQFSHWNPEHEFKWVEGSKAFNCEGCKQDGWGARYECVSCIDSHFHQECMEANPTAFNEFTAATFKLLAEPKGKGFKECCERCRRKCNACGKLVEGFVYYSEEDDIALHPRCFKLEREVSAGGITFHLRDNMAKKECACCGGKKVGSSSSSIRGWSYVSKDEGHHIHVYCAMKLFANNNDLVLKETKLSLSNKKQGKGATFLKIMLSVLSAIVGILLGDPAPLLLSVAEQLFNL